MILSCGRWSPKKASPKRKKSARSASQVAKDANKIMVKQAVEKLFNVKVEEVRTANFDGKLRRRGRFAGYRSDWKKAYVKLVAGQKVPEFTEM